MIQQKFTRNNYESTLKRKNGELYFLSPENHSFSHHFRLVLGQQTQNDDFLKWTQL